MEHTTSTATSPAGPRRLVRTGDKKVAGVAAGIGHYLGIDPTIVRIGFVALVFAGGLGLLLYAVCWLVMPKGDVAPETVAEPLDVWAALGVVGLIVGIGMLVGWHGIGDGGRAVVAVALVVGGVLLLGRHIGPRSDPGDPGTQPARPAPFGPPPSPPEEADPAAGPPSAAAARATPTTISEAAPAASESRVPVTGAIVSILAIGAAVAIAGSLAEWFDPSAGSVIAVALVVVGVGLVVASAVGRAALLIVIGLGLTAALLVAGWIGPLVDRGVGERTVRTTILAGVAPVYRFGIGDFRLDFSELRLAGVTRVRVEHGIGALRITVPADADLDVRAHIDGGDVRVPGGTVNGIDRDIQRSERLGQGGGLLILDLDMGFGEVVVDRG